MVAIVVGTTPLTLAQLRAALEGPVQVSIADEAVAAIEAAAGVVAEAMVACVLADHLLRHRAQCG